MLEEKQETVKEIVKNQEKRIYLSEIQEKKRNLLFFGINKTKSSYESLEKNIINWIEKMLSLKLPCSDIQEVIRIGKKEGKPRPIVVTFATLVIKIKILKMKKEALKNSEYYIKEDYPKYIPEKRKELQEQLKIEKEKGNSRN
ncbi:hypothetical protein EVAR_30418_1 [Eumeta japonica]|uniref:Uncharacterized protein n=1 Tax=Eumeta variegata TaxID=151549 RepID=A0A4C1W833_EUMVA|nr:hypothetical protein EVAR_30418_1 [Eumeta japonica]